ncbi:hypothetical protein CRH02_22665 [Escherichia albertii]|nr:hypothetical protein CRH02_22665 [Escherichia albertii]
MTGLKTSIKIITYLSDIGCLEIQGASLQSCLRKVFAESFQNESSGCNREQNIKITILCCCELKSSII